MDEIKKKKKKKKKRPVYFVPLIIAFVVFALAIIGYLAWQYDHGKKDEADTGPVRILVLGNDLLVTNDVPDMLRRIFSEGKQEREVEVDSIALPDTKYGIVNHLQSKSLRELLAKKNDWNLVVLQDSPKEILDSPYQLLTSIRQLQKKLKGKKTRYVFMEPFVQKDDQIKQKVVNAVSMKLCKNLSLQLAPVGEVFFDVNELYPNVRIWADDNRLPNANGSWIIAATIYSTLTGKAPDATQAKVFYKYGTGQKAFVSFSPGESAIISGSIQKTVLERNRAFKLGLTDVNRRARGLNVSQ